jgi:POT family proton-dependent oligopeptide transporter
MLIGLGVFAAGQHYLGGAGLARRRTTPHANQLDAVDWATVALTSLSVAALVGATVYLWPSVGAWWNRLHPSIQITLALTMVLLSLLTPRLWHGLPLRGSLDRLAGTSIATANPRLSRIEIDRILAIFLMGLFVVFFWMGFEQAGGTMNLFADKLTDRQVWGWEIPASHFQAVNPLLILVLAPLFSVFWVRLDRSRFALSPVVKQAIGMIILGMGFVVLAIAQERAELVGKVSVGWLLAVYFLHTTGELCLSPIGLSMVTKLAPAQLVSLMMGLWFTAIALANYLAGTLETMLAGWHVSLYWFLVATSTGAGVVLLIISPWIRRLMHGAA